ncbi:hypothetical protein DPMN_036307 [Dreissena polymorpha]|uniref:Uncharacterized protein n=1 Tax=Dreissena polymorpha TaxID=45954 RepID=A0A9D4MBA5_DREPO|nr:hypothetical protein DPMN_036307 [Dreissena polymorpha]
MKVHAVTGKGNNTIMTSHVSCYCDTCMKGECCLSTQCTEVSLVVHDKKDQENMHVDPNKIHVDHTNENEHDEILEGPSMTENENEIPKDR